MQYAQQATPRIPAAQYVRMSTEHQRYSPDNQRAAIAKYAEERGYEIVQTYIDAGKSGLTLKGREGLKSLLRDAVSGDGAFAAILVLDVSRWGRFQDIDQGGHYEWLCRSAGVSVHYVAEPFEQDGTATSSLIKQLKRVMAGEYSRELSAKVFFAHSRYAAAGYLQGKYISYGVRRLLVDENGAAKGVLEPGDWKAMRTDRVVPIPGPAKEVAVIRRIFRLYVRGRSYQRIADLLNKEGIPAERGKNWTCYKVERIIHHDFILGRYTYNRTSRRLGTDCKQNHPDEWISTQAFAPLVNPQLVHAARHNPRPGTTNKYSTSRLLRDLKRLYAKHGKLTYRLIREAPHMAGPATYQDRFGTLAEAYGLVGYHRINWAVRRAQIVNLTTDDLLAGLRRCHDRHGYISARVVDADDDIPGTTYYRKIFGSLSAAYDLAELPNSDWHSRLLSGIRRHKEANRSDGETSD